MSPTPVFPATRRRWPADPRPRWLLRAGLAAPLLVLAVLADRGGFVSSTHVQAAAAAAEVVRGGENLGGLRSAYPPVPALLAGLTPYGSLGLSVVSALVAAVMLHLVWEHLVALGLGRMLTAALLATLFAAPAVAAVASGSLTTMLTLSLLTIGLQGFVRFAGAGSTEGGFVAGLAFALAVLTSPIAVFYAVAVTGAALLVDRARMRATPHLASATLLVLLFPTVFASLSWVFLEWRFTGSALGSLAADPEVGAFPLGAGPALRDAAAATVEATLHVPLYLVGAVLIARRRPALLLGHLLPVLGTVLAVWFGLRFSAVTVYVFLTLLALSVLPLALRRSERVALGVAAVAQVVLAWTWPPSGPTYDAWVDALARVLS